MRGKTIHVTAEDIKKGRRDMTNIGACPVARAIHLKLCARYWEGYARRLNLCCAALEPAIARERELVEALNNVYSALLVVGDVHHVRNYIQKVLLASSSTEETT
jgi:hypothetical protein